MTGKPVFLIAAATCLFVASPALCDDAKSLVDRAIQAHGGKEKLAAFATSWSKKKGKVTVDGTSYNTVMELWQVYPHQLKFVMTVDVGDEQITEVQVLNGDKAWFKKNGVVAAADEGGVRIMRDNIYKEHVLRLYPLAEDRKYKLELADEISLNDRKAQGVKVSYEGYRDMTIYFDKATFLKVKEHSISLGHDRKTEVSIEAFFDEYKEVHGVQWPTKVRTLANGKPYLERTTSDLRVLKSIDSKEFEKP